MTQVIEWVWTISSVIGVLTTSWLLRAAVLDRRELVAAGRNGPGLMLADGLVRAELFRTAVLGLMTLLGVAGIVAPTPPANTTDVVSDLGFRLVAGTTLTVIAVLITVNALLDRRTRYFVDREIARVYEGSGIYANVKIDEGE